jgi:hypothetical protein
LGCIDTDRFVVCAATLAVGASIAVFGCGGSDQPEGTLDPELADSLAAKSDEVAELIDEGDECAAAHRADDLMAEVEDKSLEIDEAVLAELQRSVGHLQGQVSCAPPPPEPEKPEKTKTQEDFEEEEEEEGGGESGPPPGQGGEPPGQEKKQKGGDD